MMSVVATRKRLIDDESPTPIVHTEPDRMPTAVARGWLKQSLSEASRCVRRTASQRRAPGENAHELTIAARRGTVAMDLYSDFLPKRRARRIVRELRLLRRRADKARDLDVLAQRLQRTDEATSGDAPSHAARTDLLRKVESKRRTAQASLAEFLGRWKRKRVKRQIKRLLQRVRWRGEDAEPSFASFARSKLAPVVDEFFATAVGDVSEVAAVCEMHSCGGQLRLAMEAMASEFDPSLREQLMVSLETLQQTLGAVVDRAAAKAAFTRWTEKLDTAEGRVELEELLSEEEIAMQQTCVTLRHIWTEQRAAKLRSQFDVLLAYLDDR